MCGRFTYLYTWREVHAFLSLTSPLPFDELAHRYNVAPTQDAPVAINAPGGGQELAFMRWGLVPRWAEDISIGNRMINARAETVRTKPGFRDAFSRRRCLVPVSGFYEWQKVEGSTRKQAWYMTPREGNIVCFGGLWERWKSPEGSELRSFTILTTSPNDLMKPLHDRMPVVIAPADFERWLTAPAEDPALDALMCPCDASCMQAHRVGSWVNAPAHDDAKCVERLEQG